MMEFYSSEILCRIWYARIINNTNIFDNDNNSPQNSSNIERHTGQVHKQIGFVLCDSINEFTYGHLYSSMLKSKTWTFRLMQKLWSSIKIILLICMHQTMNTWIFVSIISSILIVVESWKDFPQPSGKIILKLF